MNKDTELKKGFGYKWVIIGLCFIMVSVSLGFGSSTKSLFPAKISESLSSIAGKEIGRSLVSITESIRYITTAVVNLFFGVLIKKLGPRLMIAMGFASLIASMLLYSFANGLVLIYIAGALLGLGLAWTTTTMVGYVVGIWCSESKGTIMGAILASNGLGGAIAIQACGALIENGIDGYRDAYRLCALVMAVTAVIVLAFFRNKPKDSIAPSVAHKDSGKSKVRGQDWVGIPFSVAVRRFYFWGALVCIFFSGLILQGTHGIVAMHYEDVGIDYEAIKAMLSFGSLILASAKFLTGFVYDRLGLRFAASLCTALAVITTFVLAFIKGDEIGFVLAIIYTVISQYALPLETVMLPIYASDLFGQRSYAEVLGLFVSVNTAGYAVGAPLMNLCYDIFGSYVPALILVGAIMSVVFVLLQFVISAAKREKRRVASECEAAQSEPCKAVEA